MAGATSWKSAPISGLALAWCVAGPALRWSATLTVDATLGGYKPAKLEVVPDGDKDVSVKLSKRAARTRPEGTPF